jgi:hypothetical protein
VVDEGNFPTSTLQHFTKYVEHEKIVSSTNLAPCYMVCICGGIICDPKGHIVAQFAWGLGSISNNYVEAYTLWKGISIARDQGIKSITILYDSLIVIRALVKGQVVGNMVLANVFVRILNLLKEFEFYKLIHIKRELNPLGKMGQN